MLTAMASNRYPRNTDGIRQRQLRRHPELGIGEVLTAARKAQTVDDVPAYMRHWPRTGWVARPGRRVPAPSRPRRRGYGR